MIESSPYFLFTYNHTTSVYCNIHHYMNIVKYIRVKTYLIKVWGLTLLIKQNSFDLIGPIQMRKMVLTGFRWVMLVCYFIKTLPAGVHAVIKAKHLQRKENVM